MVLTCKQPLLELQLSFFASFDEENWNNHLWFPNCYQVAYPLTRRYVFGCLAELSDNHLLPFACLSACSDLFLHVFVCAAGHHRTPTTWAGPCHCLAGWGTGTEVRSREVFKSTSATSHPRSPSPSRSSSTPPRPTRVASGRHATRTRWTRSPATRPRLARPSLSVRAARAASLSLGYRSEASCCCLLVRLNCEGSKSTAARAVSLSVGCRSEASSCSLLD